MSINPITTTENIREEYTKYLKSMFLFKDDLLRDEADKSIEESKKDLVKGPYLESTAMYKSGATLREIIARGELHKGFERLVPAIGEFPLHLHQELAIKKSVGDDNNMIVATGTGSGKTECFLIPILNYLVEQNENNQLTPGVRALVLYPMNALANDQLKRLRGLLKDYPEITFGRYTGETEEKQKEALDKFKKMNPNQEPLPNEILSRVEMRDNPPHILLTNYAMLEYLLLRPNDNVFFDGQYSNTWKYIVLDEAHVYSGSLGSEIAYLLARLKDRVVDGRKGELKFIATSATLGGGKKEIKDVIQYAEDLFDETFTADGLITSERVSTISDESLTKPELGWYKEFLEITEKYSGNELVQKINEKNIYKRLMYKSHDEEIVYDALIQDFYVNKLKTIIEDQTLLLQQVVQEVFGDKSESAQNNFLALVDLAAKAKKEDNSDVLLPARYHTFSKSIEGAFIRLYPESKIYLNRKEHEVIGREKVKVFELSNCVRCGQEYIIGKVEDGYIKQSSGFFNGSNERIEYFLLKDIYDGVEIDEDSVIDDEGEETEIQVNNAEPYLLCVKCGKVQPDNKRADKNCCKDAKYIKVYKVSHRGAINTCLGCGSHTRGNIVRRLINADAPTTEMLGRTLYQNIPAEQVIVKNQKESDSESLFGGIDLFGVEEDEVIAEDNGRKLLAFSDSRKEAAYFSTYMDIRYNNYLWRKIIYDAIVALGDGNINYDKLHMRIYKDIESQQDLLIDDSDMNIDEKIAAYIMYELLGYEQEIGLDGVGLVSFKLEKPVKWPAKLSLLGFDSDEIWDLIEQFFHGIRTHRALNFPDDLRPNHSLFGQRTKSMSFRYAEANAKLGIMSISPKTNYNNMRFDYLVKIFVKRGFTIDEAKENTKEFLDKIFNDNIFVKLLLDAGIYISFPIKNEGNVYQLNHKKWLFKTDQKVYRCSKCGKKTTINMNGVCPTYRCEGELTEFIPANSRHNYYIDIYNNIKRIPMRIKEHTAQLESEHASEIQSKFEQGEVNILSCSTTFEMGVDVGSLEAVFLRNIPPETANYVQRAGRAGRRTASTAYILTYAKRRSHDLFYYQNPTKIIEGKIKAPYIEKNNDKIAFRHLCSVVFSWMFRQNDVYFKDVQSMFAYNEDYPSVDEKLRELLATKPETIKISLKNVFNPFLQEKFGIENWAWVDDKLLNETGNLLISKNKWLDDVADISKIYEENLKNRRNVDQITKMLNTFLKKRVIDFLGANNVIPRYGFPIDSVDLDTIHDGKEAKSVNLNRDLKLAISEFAPGNKVIANGVLWESYAINKSRQKGWPTYLYGICEDCHTIFKEPCDYDLKRIDIEESKKTCRKEGCGAPLKLHKFIKPIFGFSTNNSKPEKPTLSKPTSTYSSKVFFHQYDENDRNFEGLKKYKQYEIPYTYSPRGNLFIVNQGRSGAGFRVCSWCGFGTTEAFEGKHPHKDKYGNKCGNEFLNKVDLGHEIITDIIEVELPNLTGYVSEEFYLSVLYAVIEGAVGYLGIDRREIDGCLNYTTASGIPSFILFDQVPGGAGHVKRIGESLDKVIAEAKNRVSGLCGCGEETSCYGCLRNYSNQMYHDILERGLALKFFKALDGSNEALQDIVASKEQQAEDIYAYCRRLNLEMPIEGYELELDNGDMPMCEIAFPEAKIAVFEEGQEIEKVIYNKLSWQTYLKNEMSLLDIAKKLSAKV